MIVLAPRDAFGLPLAVSFFALAAMTLYPTPTTKPGRGRRSGGNAMVKGRQLDGAALWFGVAVAAATCAILASSITRVVVASAVANRGYLLCAPLPGERPIHLRWIRAGTEPLQAHCPAAEERLSQTNAAEEVLLEQRQGRGQHNGGAAKSFFI